MFSEKTKVLRARRGSPEKKSVSPRCVGQYWSGWRGAFTDVFEVLQEVCDGFPLAVGEDWLVEAIAVPPWIKVSVIRAIASDKVGTVPPQQLELQIPIAGT